MATETKSEMGQEVKYKTGDILLIHWWDTAHLEGWNDERRVQNLDILKCRTVGIFHSENDTAIKTFPSVADNDEMLSPIAIPKSCIDKIEVLKPIKENKHGV